MGYDRGDSSTSDFEPNGIPFGSKSKGKLSPRSFPIQCERKWKYSFLSVKGPVFASAVPGFFQCKLLRSFLTERSNEDTVIEWLQYEIFLGKN